MLKKGSKLYSILTGTCPRCQQDYMYVRKNPFIPGENLKMHDHCRHCGLQYQIEPAFFFGAMYVSYALGVLACMIIFGIGYYFGASIGVSFAIIFGGLLILMPVITRVSRNIYINLFVNYDPKAAEQQNG